MKLITNYNEYVTENILLEALREFKFVLSSRLRIVLQQINSEISDALLQDHNDNEKVSNRTFVDIDETDDNRFTFIQPNKAGDLLGISDEEYLTDIPLISNFKNLPVTSSVYIEQRSPVRIGRFINSMYPNKFPAALRTVHAEKSKDIENFVRMYKSLQNQDIKFQNFDIVKGWEIAKWYEENKYYDQEDGSLGESCMKNVDEDYFEIYCDSSSVSMLLLKSDEDNNYIVGRALLWDLTIPTGRIFMERIYTNDSSDEQLFIDYAKSKGWLYKGSQSYGAGYAIVDPITNTRSQLKLVANVSKSSYDYYPFVDTLQFFDENNKTLSNRQGHAQYELTSTEGYADELDPDDEYGHEEPSYVWSNYYNRNIEENESVFCHYGDDWCYENDARKVFNPDESDRKDSRTNKVWAIPGNNKIVRSYIPNIVDKYFLKRKCVWSDLLNTWIFKWSKVKVYLDKDKTSFGIDYKKRLDINFGKVGRVHYSIELIEKDENDKWKLK